MLWVFLAGSVDSVLECGSREHALQLASDAPETAEERDVTAAERDAAADRRDDEAGRRDRGAELIETAVGGLERAINDRTAAANHRERSTFVDVEGLEGVNDAQGHAAGDEFICALPDIACEQARERFEEMQQILVGRGSISVGFAEIQAADVVDDLVRRADDDRARTRKGS